MSFPNLCPSDLPTFSGPLLVSSRVFPVPRDRLFETFENPDRLKLWWGPKGFTNTIHAFDFRTGGSWLFTMHGPDGKNHPNGNGFLDIDKPKRIVLLHTTPMHLFQMAMTYEDKAGKTLLTWRMHFQRPMDDKTKDYINQANEENFDRLEALLAATT